VRAYHKDKTLPSTTQHIFVFGSNFAGRHGKGAALVASKQFRAERGVGEGRTGNAYAIPTKNERLRVINLNEIRISVFKFIEYAHQNPNDRFFITRVGCDLAGYQNADIAPMFSLAPLNCSFPEEWKEYLDV